MGIISPSLAGKLAAIDDSDDDDSDDSGAIYFSNGEDVSLSIYHNINNNI